MTWAMDDRDNDCQVASSWFFVHASSNERQPVERIVDITVWTGGQVDSVMKNSLFLSCLLPAGSSRDP
jgi:hypothetical protein